jgi:hypothetical protein
MFRHLIAYQRLPKREAEVTTSAPFDRQLPGCDPERLAGVVLFVDRNFNFKLPLTRIGILLDEVWLRARRDNASLSRGREGVVVTKSCLTIPASSHVGKVDGAGAVPRV